MQNNDKKSKNGNNMELKKMQIHYECKKCKFYTNNKFNYNKHILTAKHLSNINDINNGHSCENLCSICNKTFANASGLWKHKKKCEDTTLPEPFQDSPIENQFQHVGEPIMNIQEHPETSQTYSIEPFLNEFRESPTAEFNTGLFMDFMKQNKEFQEFLLEQNRELQEQIKELAKTPATSIVNNNNRIKNTQNTQNNHFNIQVFLNETCKNAMNMSEFIQNLNVTAEDFETTGKIGYVEGISTIFINELKTMDITTRPLHCTDVKRDSIYIKDNNEWKKEDHNKTLLKEAIEKIAKFNFNSRVAWEEKHPYCHINATPENETWVKFSLVSLGGRSDEQSDKFMNKIISNVLESVTIDKKMYCK
jgi:DNA-binding transcriptional MerR regulator